MKTIGTILRTGVLAGLLALAAVSAYGSGAYTPLPPRPPAKADAPMAGKDKMMKMLVNVDASGVALAGHDPVAFFTAGKPMPGRPEFSFTYAGANYRFASAENLAKFRADPARYAPQFGGFCAYGVAHGQLAPVEVTAFVVVDGRLLMQSNAAIRDQFKQDEMGNLKMADTKWPGLVNSKGK